MTQAPIEPRHKDEAANILARPLSDCTIAQTLANLEAARAGLAEIDRIAVRWGWDGPIVDSYRREVAAIAAPYRASDPVAEASKAEEPCQRCVVLEDLLETANSRVELSRQEAEKADDEAVAHKVEMLRLRMTGSREDYALIKRFQRRAEEAEAKLRAFIEGDR